MDANPALLTVKQAAAYLTLSIGAVYELCRVNKIRHIRMGVDGGTIRIPVDACEEYLRACMVPAKPERAVVPEPSQSQPPRRQRKKPLEPLGLQYMPIPRVIQEEIDRRVKDDLRRRKREGK